MSLHISFGITVLVVIVVRLVWRITHPVAPESSLAPWQRITSEVVDWALYALVLATTMTGWLFTSFRGWSVSFLIYRHYQCWRETIDGIRAMDGWHQFAEWSL